MDALSSQPATSSPPCDVTYELEWFRNMAIWLDLDADSACPFDLCRIPSRKQDVIGPAARVLGRVGVEPRVVEDQDRGHLAPANEWLWLVLSS